MKFTAMPHYQMRKHALKKLLVNDLKKEVKGGKYKLFEIGYGAGEIFNLYKKMGICVEGYDFSEMAYSYAVQHYKEDHIILHKNMPEKEKKYDYVVACEVLEHIEDDIRALKKWKMYLKDNGKMIISVPAHKKRWGAADVYAGHYRRYEKKELEKKLLKAGLRIETIYNYDFPSCLLLDIMRHRSLGNKMDREKRLSRTNATKRSGVDREFQPGILALSCPAFWFLVIRIQRLFYKTDWGSAYILIASLK